MSYPPELDLLIGCASPAHQTVLPLLLAAQSDSIDWSKLCALAAYHRVQPLLYQRLIDYAPEIIPKQLAIELANDFRAGIARNLFLTGELITLTAAFAAAGIPVLPHKGPLLAQSAYGDLALRDFTDLDLLVSPTDLSRATDLLVSLGFLPPADLAWLSTDALLRWTGELSYTSQRGTIVDLHWRLTPNHYTIQFEPKILWSNSTSIHISGSKVPALTIEATLLLLSVHGAKHCWESVGWVADLAWLLHSNPQLDWKRVFALAKETRCWRPLLLALSLVKTIFHTPIPDLDQDPAAAVLHERVIARYQSGTTDTPRSPELFAFARVLGQSPLDSLKHLFGLLFWPTEADWKSQRLPESRFWLYTPNRVARLAKKYLSRK